MSNKGAILEYVIRFLVGGVVVSAFALLGDILRPKSFAGLFGAAPSVALATLSLTLFKEGGQYAAMEGRSMIIGSVALAARVGNVHLRNRRLLIRSRFDVVAIVTVGANCRAHVAAGDGFRVHALSIRKQWPITDAASLHDGLIAMTTAASLGNVCAIDR